jgi:HD-GYP domain-containing protein (c-di-GMP phosphodiesterase class II)
MTTTRPYRVSLPEDAVLRELVDNRGRQFDPYLIDVFLRQLEERRPAPRIATTPCPREA